MILFCIIIPVVSNFFYTHNKIYTTIISLVFVSFFILSLDIGKKLNTNIIIRMKYWEIKYVIVSDLLCYLIFTFISIIIHEVITIEENRTLTFMYFICLFILQISILLMGYIIANLGNSSNKITSYAIIFSFIFVTLVFWSGHSSWIYEFNLHNPTRFFYVNYEKIRVNLGYQKIFLFYETFQIIVEIIIIIILSKINGYKLNRYIKNNKL